jgi:glycine/D-amino acid oxidase-like deaminating enzyme/nitrite reductase/ring-hydroxylating ferredoxin subunit
MSDTHPFWSEGVERTPYPPLDGNLEIDILIVGGGITGITAAWLLSREGKSVALVERGEIGGGETGHTTAHLTYMTDTRLCELVDTVGEDATRLAWSAGKRAMDFLRETVEEQRISCDFECVPGYLVLAADQSPQAEVSVLQEEAKRAREWGFDCGFVGEDPVTRMPAVRFRDQMKFHPLRYLQALAGLAAASGARLFEHTEVTEFLEQPDRACARGHTIRYQTVLLATHVPLQGNRGPLTSTLLQTKLAPYSTYVIRATLPGSLQPFIWSDTANPFRYLRCELIDGATSLIFGGEDHRTGQEEHPENCFRSLESRLKQWFPEAVVTHHWSGQVLEPADGLPYIGWQGDHEFVATGYSGNGMSFGTAAAMLIRDYLCHRSCEWGGVFDPRRKTISAFGSYLKENLSFPLRFATDRLRIPHESPDDLPCGCGKVLRHDRAWIAAYRDEQGKLHLNSAICPHMACLVTWNEAEMTWDCPCHGSRFTATGQVFAGPAESDLVPIDKPQP